MLDNDTNSLKTGSTVRPQLNEPGLHHEGLANRCGREPDEDVAL